MSNGVDHEKPLSELNVFLEIPQYNGIRVCAVLLRIVGSVFVMAGFIGVLISIQLFASSSSALGHNWASSDSIELFATGVGAMISSLLFFVFASFADAVRDMARNSFK